MKNEIYISTDIESDGPIPGPYSMLSIGSVAFHPDGRILHEFSANLQQLPGAQQDEGTMAFWQQHPEAWEATRKNAEQSLYVMKRYCEWVEFIDAAFGEPVFVGYPVTFDFMFVCWYLHSLVGKCPFKWDGIDIKTFAMSLMGTPYRDSSKKSMPREWFPKLNTHAHVAIADAMEQGLLFSNMLNVWRGRISHLPTEARYGNYSRDTDSYKTSK